MSWYGNSMAHSMASKGVRTSQLTTKTAKHPNVKRWIEIAIKSTGIDDPKLKFSISKKHDHAYYVNSTVYMPTNMGFHSFFNTLLHEMIHHQMLKEEKTMSMTENQIEAEVIKRTNIAMQKAKQYLDGEEVELIEEAEQEIEYWRNK